MSLRRLLGLVLMAITVVWGCSQSPTASSKEGLPMTPSKPGSGLEFVLSEGSPGADEARRPPQARAQPLDATRTEALMRRLPALKELPGQKQDFALRESSLPPPRAGRTEAVPFPAPVKPEPAPKIEKGPLTVLRFAPEGEVEVVPQLSLTFSQPMVAVTSHAETMAPGVPVKLTPSPEGNWRWVGSRTLLFEPRGGDVSPGHAQHRFPKATEYTVEVPAGTRSATGGELGQAVRFTFKTPPVKLEGYSPSGGPHGLEPLMYATFDQDVDSAAVLANLQVSIGQIDVPIRKADPKEVAGSGLDPASRRWVAFKAVSRLEPAHTYTVSVRAGTPSAEGPLKTPAAQTFTFRTYDPFRIEESRCGWNNVCRPLEPFYVRFNNPIDPEKFDPDTMLRVEPKLPGLHVDASGTVLWIRGQTKGRTKYTVRLAPELPDSFGQTLGKEVVRTFDVGTAEPSLRSQGGQMVVLDPYAKPVYPVFLINHKKLRVRLWSVTPEDWPEYLKRLREQRHDKDFVPPGRPVQDEVVQTGAREDELTELPLRLDKGLQNGKGMVVVQVEPAPQNARYLIRLISWVQVTGIGLDA
ncbi:MAG: Ig-like domain-containing protein, partial [Candidatus Eremiobacterota bacterium]